MIGECQVKLLLLVFVFLTAATPASAAQRFKGKLLYRGDNEVWMPASGVGYKHFKSRGDITFETGPFSKILPVRCYGTSYWTTKMFEAEGICIFGRMPDTWTVRYVITETKLGDQRRERFHRVGDWTAIGGTGKYDGIAGFGRYLAEPARDDFLNVTHWEGEVDLPAPTD